MARVKDKEIILKQAREKTSTYKGNPIRLSADFFISNFIGQREWQDFFKELKERTLQPRLIYPARNSRTESFPAKRKLKNVITTIKSALQEV